MATQHLLQWLVLTIDSPEISPVACVTVMTMSGLCGGAQRHANSKFFVYVIDFFDAKGLCRAVFFGAFAGFPAKSMADLTTVSTVLDMGSVR